MKKGLILSRKSDLYSIQRFLEEAKSFDLQLSVIAPKDILDQPPAPRSFDFVLPRVANYMLEESFAAIDLLEKQKIPSLNRSAQIALVKDKWRFYQWCLGENLPTPLSSLSSNEMRYPLIQKPRWGSKGENIFLIPDPEHLQYLPVASLFQEFIEEARGQDLRVLTLQGKIVGHYQRSASPGEFRSNLAMGGTASLTDLPPAVAELARRAALKLSGLGLIGFDFLLSRRGPLILEANASPGFTGIESLTTTNMAALIIQACLQLSSKI